MVVDRRFELRKGCGRFALGVAMAVAVALSCVQAALGQDEKPSLCECGPNTRASVIKVERQAGADTWLSVERGLDVQQAKAGCFLQPGDIVRPGAGVSAEINMPDNTVRPVKFPDVVEIPEVAVTGSFRRLMDFALDIIGKDWQETRDMAAAIVGDTREMIPSQYLIMPGVYAVGEQSIDPSHTLSIRWVGSTAPYSISMAKDDGGAAKVLDVTDDRHANLTMSGVAPGVYTLEIKGANGISLELPVRLVAAKDVPLLEGATTDEPSSQEYRLEEALFLLRRAPPTWRVEAISRLLVLANENQDFFAQAIVGLENTTRK